MLTDGWRIWGIRSIWELLNRQLFFKVRIKRYAFLHNLPWRILRTITRLSLTKQYRNDIFMPLSFWIQLSNFGIKIICFFNFYHLNIKLCYIIFAIRNETLQFVLPYHKLFFTSLTFFFLVILDHLEDSIHLFLIYCIKLHCIE